MGTLITSTSTNSTFREFPLQRLVAVLVLDLLLVGCSTAHAAVTTTGDVDPAPTTTTSSDNLYVGDSADGTMTVDGGSTVECRDSYIGDDRGATGAVTVTGSGSLWDIGTYLTVGNYGDGSMTVSQEGEVTSYYGAIGVGPSAHGTVTVSGAGAQWYNSMGLTVGGMGSGSLTVEQGALMHSYRCMMGSSLDAEGIVSISGPGTQWGNNFELTVGYLGTGSLTVAQDAVISSYRTVIASASSAEGTVSISGADSEWTNSYLTVGRNGNGSLVISDGASLTSYSDKIGFGSMGRGTVAVSGAGSSYAPGILYVAYGGPGDLTIDGGASVACEYSAHVAYGPSSDGHVTVSGVGSSWTARDLELGYLGAASLLIVNGATVETTTDFEAALYAGSTADLEFRIGPDGVGRLVVGRDIDLTGYGTTNLILSADPTHVFTHGQSFDLMDWGDDFFGEFDGVTLPDLPDGWIWDTSGLYTDGVVAALPEPVTLGLLSLGSVVLLIRRRKRGGACGDLGGSNMATALVGLVVLSCSLTAHAAVTTTGDVHPNPTTTTLADSLYVGDDADGAVVVDDGSGVECSGLYLGYESAATGRMTVTGNASTLTSGAVYVGSYGQGELTIADGGYMVSGRATVGAGTGSYSETSHGTVTVTGEGTQWIAAGISLSYYGGDSSLAVEQGAIVQAYSLYAGYYDEESNNQIAVTGPGTQLVLDEYLRFRSQRSGSMLIANGAVLQANDCRVGASRSDADFQVTVTGAGTQWITSDEIRVGAYGYARVIIDQGAIVQADGIRVGSASDPRTTEIVVDGATLDCGEGLYVGITGGSGSVRVVNGSAMTSSYGYIGYIGTGEVVVSGPGSHWINSRDLIVGYTNEGRLTIENGATVVSYSTRIGHIGSSALEFVIGHDGSGRLITDYDLSLHRANNELIVRGADGFSFAPGQSFDLMDWGGYISGEFDTVTLAELQPGWSWDTSRLYTDGIVEIVPEPGCVSMLLLGGLALLERRRAH